MAYGKSKLPKLKNNPFTLLKNIKTSRVNVLPVWAPVISLFPPAPCPIKSAIPEQIGAFLPENYIKDRQRRQVESSTRIQDSRVKCRPTYYTKPFDIVYPEDAMRKDFYQTHPFELQRPFCIVETQETLRKRTWNDIDGGQDHIEPVPLSGERQLSPLKK